MNPVHVDDHVGYFALLAATMFLLVTHPTVVKYVRSGTNDWSGPAGAWTYKSRGVCAALVGLGMYLAMEYPEQSTKPLDYADKAKKKITQ
jgi:hypothetical protein